MVLIEGVLDRNKRVLAEPALVVFDHLGSCLLHVGGPFAGRILEVQVVLLCLGLPKFGRCNIGADLHLVRVARLLDSLHEHIQSLVVVLHSRGEAALVANVASVLPVLFLDHRLQCVVDLGADFHRILKRRRAGGQDHELLACQTISSMASTVDDIEGRHGHHELVHRLARELRDVLVQGHLARSSTSAAHGHGHRQNCVGAQLRLGPAPLVLRAVQDLHHDLVDGGLLRYVHADELRCYDVVNVGNCLQNALAQQSALVVVPQLQGLVDTCGCTARHSRSEQLRLRAQVDLDSGVPPRIEDLTGP
mmetsp:Transcript_74637/g.216563  ORF Transcript_74637/g.216563 Transcript_74637/m.216563 type:complete len:306 (+) Transcript_74637:489-1406(+)